MLVGTQSGMSHVGTSEEMLNDAVMDAYCSGAFHRLCVSRSSEHILLEDIREGKKVSSVELLYQPGARIAGCLLTLKGAQERDRAVEASTGPDVCRRPSHPSQISIPDQAERGAY